MDEETLTTSLLKRVEQGDLTVADLVERKEQREYLQDLGYSVDPAVNNHYISICEALDILQQ